MARYGIVVDLNRCTGCMTCVLACKEENRTGPGIWWDSVLEIEDETLDHIIYVRYACMHCDNPPCVAACPEKAIFKRPDGIVLIDQQKCKGHRECVKACPYGVIVTNPRQNYFPEKEGEDKGTIPDYQNQVSGKASKCTLCAHRIDAGKEPACVVACPSKAMVFGDLEDPESRISEKLGKAEALRQEADAQPKVFYVVPNNFLKPLEERVKQNPKMMRD